MAGRRLWALYSTYPLLQIYSLLCVISQYQEYMAGRGTAADDYEYRVSILTVSQRKQERAKGRKVKCTNCILEVGRAGHDMEAMGLKASTG